MDPTVVCDQVSLRQIVDVQSSLEMGPQQYAQRMPRGELAFRRHHERLHEQMRVSEMADRLMDVSVRHSHNRLGDAPVVAVAGCEDRIVRRAGLLALNGHGGKLPAFRHDKHGDRRIEKFFDREITLFKTLQDLVVAVVEASVFGGCIERVA